MRRAARTDANQSQIANVLRQTGATVVDLSRVGQGVPDLLIARSLPCPHCGSCFPQNVLIEVKTPGGKLNQLQQEFHASWRGPIVVARSISDALAALGIST